MSKVDLGDDPSQTILVVEVSDSDIHWAEPGDFELSKMAIGINKSDTEGVSSHHGRELFTSGKPGRNTLRGI